ncbi:HAD-IA family hydrolase [Desulfovibrio aerotolerans]|uniref:HAD-IA family hydrolase n=1 Tax=Solidesulfovibrio aerotolerans TaxID=295255 RepID=A0A7C9IWE0_9BACT|nr:HAD family phosphatase [Solidesulfovibrio aerotolerans]MYL83522.1 HAD-IA family hydrolase [Solidesulfovibrio aerotolerans]
MRELCGLAAVFFDFGGVLAEEGFREGLIHIATAAGRDPAEVLPLAYEMAWSTGFVLGSVDEAGFWEAFRRATGIAGRDEDLSAAVLSRFVPRPFMFAVADAARAAGLKTAILSDQTEWLARLDAAHDVFSHFDMVFNSYDHGTSKREAAFFHIGLQTLGVAPQKALFIDDAAHNTDLAASLGFKTILYRDRASFFEELSTLCPPLGATHV